MNDHYFLIGTSLSLKIAVAGPTGYSIYFLMKTQERLGKASKNLHWKKIYINLLGTILCNVYRRLEQLVFW